MSQDFRPKITATSEAVASEDLVSKVNGGGTSSMNEHSRLIAAAAKAVLQPAGFTRKGRSRLWFADRGFWLSVIEFQPSAWSRGSYLNVAAHWLWGKSDQLLSFDKVERVNGFIEFESAEQFEPAARRLAEQALQAAEQDILRFRTIDDVAAFLIEREEKLRIDGRGGDWSAYDAGVAASLAGRADDAHRMLLHASVSGRHSRPCAVRLLSMADEPNALNSLIKTMINGERGYFGFGPLTS